MTTEHGREAFRTLATLATRLVVRAAIGCALLIGVAAAVGQPVLSLFLPASAVGAATGIVVTVLGLLSVPILALAWGYDMVRRDIAALDERWDSGRDGRCCP